MEELHREYTLLFNGITEAIKQLESARGRLVKLQQDAEEFYLARTALDEETDAEE